MTAFTMLFKVRQQKLDFGFSDINVCVLDCMRERSIPTICR